MERYLAILSRPWSTRFPTCGGTSHSLSLSILGKSRPLLRLEEDFCILETEWTQSMSSTTRALKSIRHAKKSEVIEQDSLRCTGLKWFMMRHKEISRKYLVEYLMWYTYTMDMNLKLKLSEVPYLSTWYNKKCCNT